MIQPRDFRPKEPFAIRKTSNINNESDIRNDSKTTGPSKPVFVQRRHQGMLQKVRAYFPLIIYHELTHTGYTKEHLIKCFAKALQNMNFEEQLDKIDRVVLRRVFSEFSIFVTNFQLSEGFFFATFNHIIDKTDQATEDQKIKTMLAENNHFDSKVFLDYQNVLKNDSSKTGLKNKDAKFNLNNFLSWLQNTMHKFRNFTQIETAEYENFKKAEADEKLVSSKKPQSLNKSMDDANTRRPTRKMSLKPLPKTIFSKNSNYKDLYNLLEKKKMLQLEYPEVDLKKSPETKPVIPQNRNQSPLLISMRPQTGNTSSNIDLASLQKKVKASKESIQQQEEDKHVGYKILGNIDHKIKGQIATCFQGFQGESEKTKRVIFDTIKQIHMEKLTEDAESAMQYAKAAEYRVNFAQERNKLKGMEELVMLMREQPSALEATRLYEMLYTKDEVIKEELKRFHQKKRVKGEAEYRVKMLLKDKNLGF